MVRNERTDLEDASSEILSQYLEEFRAVFDRMSANGGNLTRRDFMKLSAAGLLSFFLSACKAGTLTPTPEQPKTSVAPTSEPLKPKTAVSPTSEPIKPTATRPPEMTPTLSETYPKALSELKPVPDMPEAEFLKKYSDPSLKKEYDLLKNKWIEALQKIGVSEKDVDFTVNEYAWNGGYSWVLGVTGKDGSVFVPRDTESHVRMIDHSAYQNAMKGVAFTAEKLPFPEFHNFEYEIVRGRSEKGWLGMMLRKRGDANPMAWYNMKAEVAKWEDQNKRAVVLTDGMRQEQGVYLNSDQLEIDKMISEIASAISANKIFASQDPMAEESGVCFPTSLRDITVGIRECKSIDGKLLRVAVAWRRSDGSYLLRAGDDNFVVARSSESGSNLVMRGFESISPELKLVFGSSWINTDRAIMMMENPVDGSIFLPNGNGGVWIDRADIDLMAFNFLPKRQTPGYGAINYGRTKLSTDSKSFESLISGVRFVDVNGKDITQTDDQYVAKIRKILSKAGEVYSESEKAILGSFDKMILRISSAQTSFSSQSQHGNVDNFLTVPVAFLNRFGDTDSVMSEIFLSYIVHESTHSTQKRGGDVEFQAFLNQLKLLVRRKHILSNVYVSYFISVLKTGNYLTQVK